MSVCVLTLISPACAKNSSDKNSDYHNVKKFFEMREAGNTQDSWKMLSEKSRSVFTEKEFKEYSFIYKVSDIIDIKKEGEYFKVRYNYYNKKFKKNSDELYTFYITENVENLKVGKTGIIFPYTGYYALRKAVEKGEMSEVSAAVRKMLNVDKSNPDVLKSAEKMGSTGH